MLSNKKKPQNNLVGCRVLIDWPVRWKDCREEFKAEQKERAKREEHRFGECGEIVAYNPTAENAKTLAILLDDGRIEDFYEGAVTVTERPKPPVDESAELLRQILDLLQKAGI